MNQLDKDIYELREEKKVLQSLDKLMNNPDFKKVILEDFLVAHAISLVHSKGRLGLEPSVNQDIDKQLECVAMFKMYLDSKVSKIADIDVLIHNAETLRDEQLRNN